MQLSKTNEDGKIFKEPYFNAGPFTVINRESIIENIETAIEKNLETIAGWLSEGSGWVIEEVLNHYINIVSYLPLKAKSYIPLSEELRNSRKGLINLQNRDDQCFRWCHIRHLNPLKIHPERITGEDRAYVKKLDYTPVSLKVMDKIEKQNSINVNVFGYNNGAYPIRISKENFEDHLELLWIEGTVIEREKIVEKSHFVLITDFNRLMTSFTKHKDKKHFCMHCLHCCSSKRVLDIHKEDCLAINGTQAIRIYFKNH